MNFETLTKWLVALPALVVALLFGHGVPDQRAAQRIKAAVTAPTPSTTPGAVRGTETTMATPIPGPLVSKTSRAAKSAPAATKTEIASEQVCPGQGDVAKAATALACLTSNARTFHGLRAVSANSALMAAAVAKNQDMLKCGYGHTACGREFNYWITGKGYPGRCSAENIAAGQRTPREVFVAWMNSAGHRANILNRDFRHIGVSEVASAKGPMWVMMLGGC